MNQQLTAGFNVGPTLHQHWANDSFLLCEKFSEDLCQVGVTTLKKIVRGTNTSFWDVYILHNCTFHNATGQL